MKRAIKNNANRKPAVGIFLTHLNLSRVAAEMLTAEGFSAERYFSQRELIAALQTEPPDALVVDMDMNGAFEISRRARQINPELAVVMISTGIDRKLPQERTCIHSFSSSWRDMLAELKRMLISNNTATGNRRKQPEEQGLRKERRRMNENTYSQLRKMSPKVTGSLIRMRQETFRDAAVPAKYKILAALVAVVVTKCEPCIKAYTKMARQNGVTARELVEFLDVAMTEGGCPAEQWALVALRTFGELEQGKKISEEICCKTDDDE